MGLRYFRKLSIFTFFLSLFSISLISQIDFSTAQPNDESLLVPLNFKFEEFSQNIDSLSNLNSIDIPLPPYSCNLTNLHLNFSDIRLGREIKVVEDEVYGEYSQIYFKNPSFRRYGLAVQINLTEPTIIYGTYIYGYKSLNTKEIIQVQLRGFDALSKKPNTTIYASKDINMSYIPGWYLQNFISPVKLSKGNYFLTLYGVGMVTNINTSYFWAYNEYTPSHPSLFKSEYITGWTNGVQNSPYLYKLIQKTDKIYDPEEINMSVGINGIDYKVINSTESGSGALSVNGLNWEINNEFLSLPIRNALNIELNFSLSYWINIKSNLLAHGSVLIKDGQENIWTINPQFIRYYENYSIYFSYPSNWNNFMIFRNHVNISSLVYINTTEKFIRIENNTLIEGAEWEITANSPRFDVNLAIHRTDYGPGQEIRFSIDSPVRSGNYTFVLYAPDQLEITEARQNITLPSDSNIFTYNIPLHPLDGNYYAFIYFYDGVDAGVGIIIFRIIIPFTIDPLTLFFIILTAAVALGGTISIVVGIKRHRRKVVARKEEVIDRCMDILNLNYIMVAEKKSSLNVYEQVFTSKKIDPTLISGFLSAIHSFGIELTNTEEKTQTIKLEFKNSKVIMSEFKNFRLVLIMNQLPSQKFLDSINQLAFDIELYYGQFLETFKGNVDPFRGIEALLKKHLNISFLYPLKVVKTGKSKVEQNERVIIARALETMKKNHTNYFYVAHIMDTKKYDPKDLEAIFKLIEKKIFQPAI